MAAAGAWEVHNLAKEKMAKALVDLDGDSFVIRLYTSASDIDTPADNDASAATGEVSNANGYLTGGKASLPSVSQSGGITNVDFADTSWDATGAGITARFAAIIDTTLTPDEIIAHCVLDATPADAAASAGNQFVVQFHANGAFQLV